MQVDRRSDPVTTTRQVTLAEVRCSKCNRLICKTTPRAVRDGEMVEIECWKCGDKNYLMGGPKT